MKYTAFFFLIGFLLSCQTNQADQQEPHISKEGSINMEMPEWAKNSNIYEVNIRQYTEEGTLNAFSEHLPRLKEMGVDILWFMPIYPISSTKRKGGLGSYYAVSDFREVNPEFGSMEDMDKLIQKIHDLEMKIILDWVPNHTGWDHRWIEENPDFYTRNADGEITDPLNPDTGESWGWTDVADLNYDNMEMRKTMIEDLKFWVQDHDIDGYRCDVAFAVPDDFWDEAVPQIQSIKNVFMLAEAEHPPHRNSGNFHMSYGWGFHHLLNEIAKGEKNAKDVQEWIQEDENKFEKGFHMMFTSNHDENSWNGTVFERMGEAHKALAVLASTVSGMPLIYSGQEEPLRKRLKFFEKDHIGFENYEYAPFYTDLLKLKHNNEALWNGEYGGKPEFISDSEEILVYKREVNGNAVIVAINLTDSNATASLTNPVEGNFKVAIGESVDLLARRGISLQPWSYSVQIDD